MSAPDLESGGAFYRRALGMQTVIGFASAAIVCVYLTALVRFTPEQWKTFSLLLGAFVVGVTVLSQFVLPRFYRPVGAWLDARLAGSETREQARAALRAVLVLPRNVSLYGAGAYVLAGLLVGLSMELVYPELQGAALWQITVAAAGAGCASNVYLFYAAKQIVSPVLGAICKSVPDPSERAQVVPSLLLGTKLLVAFAGVSISTVVFAVMLAQVRAERPVEAHLVDLQGRFLELHLQSIRFDPEPVRDEARAIGLADDVLVFDPRAEDASLAALELLPETVGAVRASSATSGNSAGLESRQGFAWRRLADGRVALLWVATDRIDARTTDLWRVFALVLLVASAVSVLVARVVARDVAGATAALSAEAERIAGGDFTPGRIIESEDELGDLGRAFQRMSSGLRSTMSRVSSASDRVDGSASEMASLATAVAQATVEQVSGLHQAAQTTEVVREQVAGIADSAQALNESVEESSSSILEMGAAGEELNQTASVLSGKVDEVSSSIEQMIRGVGELGRQVDVLSQASEETSSSVGEMAGSMREVDANASEMARLSSQVVAVAEGGRVKVQETIAGMDEIRDATDTAEGVIRGLGVRAKEIGAIVDVIDDVADETNLLALNAAIIAAQAGEHGRAFSVVADEIKELADRVMASTKEIGGLIRSVQEESSAAIGAMERGSASVLAGVERSAEAGESLEAITQTARESGHRIGEIVQAVQEQSKAAGHVQDLMERVRSSVEGIRNGATEQGQGNEVVLRGSMTMREVAQQVHRTTEEQARGAGRIRESVESVRLAVERIHVALQAQKESCSEGAIFMERAHHGARSNDEATERMGSASNDLLEQAAGLREEVARFRF